MKKELFPVFVIIAITLLFVFIIFICCPEVKPKIVIHEADGKSHKILQTEQGFDEISKECMDILSSIDGQYKLAMSYNELNGMKRGNKYIEIINCCNHLSCGQKRFPLFELIFALEFKPQDLILEPWYFQV